jgi:hypothetical protein
LKNKGLIADKYDYFLLKAQQKKAFRLVLQPLVKHLSIFKRKIDPEKLLRAVDGYIGAVESLETNNKWFDGFEATVEGLFDQLPERSKGSPDSFDEPEGDSVAGDPRFSEKAYLYYVMGQFVEKAVAKQFIYCVAQNGSRFSIIAAREFSGDEEDEGFPLPAELDPVPIERFTEHWCEQLGADRLWFALAFDLESDFRDILSTEDLIAEEETNAKKGRGSGRGFEAKDEPFVEFAIELLNSERANNPNDAMRMIEDRLWKEIAPDAESFEKAVAGGGHYDSKRQRLYNQVNKCWKEHPENR